MKDTIVQGGIPMLCIKCLRFLEDDEEKCKICGRDRQTISEEIEDLKKKRIAQDLQMQDARYFSNDI